MNTSCRGVASVPLSQAPLSCPSRQPAPGCTAAGRGAPLLQVPRARLSLSCEDPGRPSTSARTERQGCLSGARGSTRRGILRPVRCTSPKTTETEVAESSSAASCDDDTAEARMKPQRGVATEGNGGGFKILGLDPTPEVLAISMVYFVQGILGLARLATTFYFKDELHLDPAQVTLYSGIAAFPWVIKPIYGFLSDTVPIFGYKRRSYLVLCGLLGAVSWLGLTQADNLETAVLLLILGSFGTACSDVVVDSIVVERTRGQPQSVAGSLQSLCWGSSAMGSIMSAYFSGSLVDAYGTRFVFGLTAVFPLIASVAGGLVNEQRIDSKSAMRKKRDSESGEGQEEGTTEPAFLWRQFLIQCRALWGAIRAPAVLLPATFVFLWQATPVADSAMFFFETNELGLSAEFLGRVSLVASVASLIGVGVYNTMLKDVPLKKMFLWTGILGTALGSTQLLLVTGANKALGLSNELFVLGDSAMLTVLGRVSFMPVLVLAARICPEGVEATLFATLMSLLNGGSMLGSALGAVMTDSFGVTSDNFDNLPPLVAATTLLTLAPLPFLFLLPKTVDVETPPDAYESDVEEDSEAAPALSKERKE